MKVEYFSANNEFFCFIFENVKLKREYLKNLHWPWFYLTCLEYLRPGKIRGLIFPLGVYWVELLPVLLSELVVLSALEYGTLFLREINLGRSFLLIILALEYYPSSFFSDAWELFQASSAIIYLLFSFFWAAKSKSFWDWFWMSLAIGDLIVEILRRMEG